MLFFLNVVTALELKGKNNNMIFYSDRVFVVTALELKGKNNGQLVDSITGIVVTALELLTTFLVASFHCAFI